MEEPKTKPQPSVRADLSWYLYKTGTPGALGALLTPAEYGPLWCVCLYQERTEGFGLSAARVAAMRASAPIRLPDHAVPTETYNQPDMPLLAVTDHQKVSRPLLLQKRGDRVLVLCEEWLDPDLPHGFSTEPDDRNVFLVGTSGPAWTRIWVLPESRFFALFAEGLPKPLDPDDDWSPWPPAVFVNPTGIAALVENMPESNCPDRAAFHSFLRAIAENSGSLFVVR